MQHFGKILPVDGYEVRLEESLPSDYLQSLMHLYQPLLGIEAVSLYQLLIHEIDFYSEVQIQTHHTLMNYLNLPLDRIYGARCKLEGIGLLKTFQEETEERVCYTYLLQIPFSPEQFFQDTMLSELLYRHIGKSKFTSLRKFYTKREKQLSGQNITVSFNDVFQTFQPTNNHRPPAPFPKEKTIGVPVEQIDFLPLKQALKRKMIPVDKVLTEKNKMIITQLVHLYELEAYEIENALTWALTDENKLDVEQFKAACHDLFRTKHNVAEVKLSVKQAVQKPEQQRTLTREENLIEIFETISPKQLLEDLSAGHNASEQDMKMISELMIRQGLPAPVMNVLIHYVLLQSDMKLSKAYLEKIASHWSRAQLKSAKEAVEFAKKQTEQATKPKPRKSYSQKKRSNEIIPDWFKEREEQNKEGSNEEVVLTKEQEQEEAEMIALLQKYAQKNN